MLKPLSLLGVSHYRQASCCHPMPRTIPAGRILCELVTGGRGWVEHAGEWVEVRRGSLLWHWPGDCTIGRSDFAAPYRCLATMFEADPGGSGERLPRISSWSALEDINDFVRLSVNCFLDETFDREALLAYVYGHLLFYTRLRHHLLSSPDSPIPLKRVLAAIDKRYREPLQLDDLAVVAGWSVPHLHAMAQQHLGMSHRALVQRRLKAARELLATTTLEIKEIAEQCGFSSSTAFCRSFHQANSTTPTAFRRQHSYPWSIEE